MSVADELERLEQLRARGTISDEEFERAKATVLGGGSAGGSAEIPGLEAVQRLRRSKSDRWIGGVCGGLAKLTGVEAWIWRLIFAAVFLCVGFGALIYILLWIFVPEES